VATPALEETYDLAPAFFDTIDHDWMIRFLEHRIADRRDLKSEARTPRISGNKSVIRSRAYRV
jgi:hypothetical protein